jgi:N-acetylglucosaminyl-diphospho-decaprenol L-rhamnosyltransferase
MMENLRNADVHPTVSIVIVNYNSGKHLANAVEALAQQSVQAFEAIVLDNSSSDESFLPAQRAAGDDKRFSFLTSEKNLGFAAGNNFAAAKARGAWLAFLNPDAVPNNDWLEQLLQARSRHPDVVMFGSTQIDAADPQRLDGAGDHYLASGLPWRGGHGWRRSELPPEGEVFGPCAAACLIRADAFRAVNGFDERFFCYVEDVDLAFRLRLLGHRCAQIPTAVVQHFGGISTGLQGEPWARRFGTRNVIWCFVKCMPTPLFLPLLPAHVLMLFALLLRASTIGMLPAVWQGIIMAVKGIPYIWSSRRSIQCRRRVSAWEIARALSWNPIACLRRVPRTLRNARP